MKFFVFISLLQISLCSNCFGQNIACTPDTINTQNGTLILKQYKNNVKHLKNKFRSSIEIEVRDKKDKALIPSSFIGINKVMIQTGKRGTVKFYLQKGKYKISASYLGSQEFSTHIKIDLDYDYRMEILISPNPNPLY